MLILKIGYPLPPFISKQLMLNSPIIEKGIKILIVLFSFLLCFLPLVLKLVSYSRHLILNT